MVDPFRSIAPATRCSAFRRASIAATDVSFQQTARRHAAMVERADLAVENAVVGIGRWPSHFSTQVNAVGSRMASARVTLCTPPTR